MCLSLYGRYITGSTLTLRRKGVSKEYFYKTLLENLPPQSVDVAVTILKHGTHKKIKWFRKCPQR